MSRIEKSSLTSAFRKALLTSVASLSLLIGSVGFARAQTTGTTAVKDSTTQTVTQLEPWQTDEGYMREMAAADEYYQARLNVIYANANDQITRLRGNTKLNNSRMWNGRVIRPIENIQRTKVNNDNLAASEERIMSNADLQAANAKTQYEQRVQQIETRYKNNYIRLNPGYGKGQQEQKIDSLQNEIKIRQLELKLEQQQQQLDKLKNQTPPKSPAKKP